MVKTYTIPYNNLYSDDWSIDTFVLEDENFDERVPLIDFVDINIKRFSKEELDDNTNYRYCSISSIDNEKNIISELEQYKKEELPTRAKIEANKGDILLPLIRPKSSGIALVDKNYEDLLVTDGIAVLTPKKKDISYLLYFLLTSNKVLEELDALAKGTVQRLNIKKLKEYRLPIYGYREEDINKAKTLYEKINSNSISLAEEINDFFKDELIEKPHEAEKEKKFMRINYDQLKADRFDVDYFYLQASKPKWRCEIKKLKDIANYKKIKNPPKKTEENNYNSNYRVPFLKVQDLGEDSMYVMEDSVEYVISEYSDEIDVCVKENDIIIPKIGDNITRSSLASKDLQGSITNQYLYVYTPGKDILAEYLVLFLKSKWSREQIGINLTGARRTINRKVIENLEVPVPDIEKQKEFVKIISEKKKENDFKILEAEIKKFKNDLVF